MGLTTNTVINLRIRYAMGLSVIALLITASYITMQKIVSKQQDFYRVVNLAGHQSGLTSRIAYFSSLMATTEDEEEFGMAQAQIGRSINKMKSVHKSLLNGDAEKGIPGSFPFRVCKSFLLLNRHVRI